VNTLQNEALVFISAFPRIYNVLQPVSAKTRYAIVEQYVKV
jgi:hypothetical protein